MPDKGAMVEELAVLGKEFLAQPGFQRLASVIGLLQQFREPVVVPGIAIGSG
jgi:hypothetical protein